MDANHLSALAAQDRHDSPGASTTTTTTSPDHHATGSALTDKTFTPLSLLDDSFPAPEPFRDVAKPARATPSADPTIAPPAGPHSSDNSKGPSNDSAAVLHSQGWSPPDTNTNISSPSKTNRHTPSTEACVVAAAPPHNPVPLRTSSVRHDTKLVHPKPINLTTSTSSLTSPEPGADLHARLGSHVGNVAQLEATAEQLSRTSSIDHAIRDLHGELKRSDSRRSSILAARTSPSTDANPPGSAIALKRALSNASSIVPTNTAARHGGYSPAAFIMSPSNSVGGRLRSNSKTSTHSRADSDHEQAPGLSRGGPGKASVRSVRSAKPCLAEIAESAPPALDMKAFDEADMAPPIEEFRNFDRVSAANDEQPRARDSHDVLAVALPDWGGPADPDCLPVENHQRPATSQSNNTFQDDENAFIDFDGVHWDPSQDDGHAESLAQPREQQPRAVAHQRKQSYIDPLTGQQMMWYPAPVPAYLNVPKRLSAQKPQGTRDVRRSQVLSAMVMSDYQQPADHGSRRHSAMPTTQRRSRMLQRDSWLPDPLAGHRESFIGLDAEFQGPAQQEPEQLHAMVGEGTSVPEQAHDHESTTHHLKRPPRLTDPSGHQRTSSTPLERLPPQLRASAYFELPSVAPQIEVKDGSAMATLDSILDASARAPANAFTDHAIVGRLGNEVYGKQKKRQSLGSAVALSAPVASAEPKKRSSFMWLTKRKSNVSGIDDAEPPMPDADHEDRDGHERRSEDDDEQSMYRVDADGNPIEDASEVSDAEDEYQGPPTTLLAELQLRKQQQKQRTQHLTEAFPNGMHATLLEMDAVAEAQRKQRSTKRVNLAWEDPAAHLDEDESDDEDVPLAILAAKKEGAKTMADVDRPLGLLERREIEENEPLSKRKARLQGLETKSLANLQQRASVLNLSAPAPRPGGERTLSRAGITPSPVEHEHPEIEEETLGERKRRLAAQDGADSVLLPDARPVSRAFTDELLGQFAPEPEAEPEKPATPEAPAEEETLGQRRRRLQAEKEAREREMSYSNLVGGTAEKRNSRFSMADILTAYPKKEEQGQAQRAVAARRPQVQPTLTSQISDRQGGYLGGMYNNGFAGRSPASQSASAVNLPGAGHLRQASSTFDPYSHQHSRSQHQLMHGMGMPLRQHASQMNMNAYGHGMMHPGMGMRGPPPMPVQAPMPLAPQNGGSMDRVEMWRQGIH